MLKDKKKSKTTIRNVMNENPVKTQQAKAESNIQAYKYTPEYAESLKKYNENILTLDENYTKIKPLSKLIVRCYVHEPEISESGLVTPYKQMVQVPTNSGQGAIRVVESDWPYKNKVVAVAVPENSSIQVGDILQVNGKAVDVHVMGTSQNAFLAVLNGFVQVDSVNQVTPMDINDPDYGYVLISYGDVIAKY